ncbi:MAG TPA: serine/threonine-protein kinase [Polyangiales bacterium]|nr:serine/threonine-protein kinase [Polyangiales bacterium]
MVDVVGSGGMGVVYRAQNIVTAKYVALKWLHPRFASGVGGERLLREARAASLLKHPHIVDVYDLTKDTASDTWVLVMELLKGETLREYMQRSASIKLSSFIALISPAIGAVVAAHELGIVHRDLKPENIFLERVPSANRVVPKVLDFGIAKLNDPGSRTLTATGTTLGTPYYMSPEQYLGEKDIDARTDVYAFGALLYEAITGRMPHTASSLPALALKVTTVDVPPVKSLCPSIPSSLARLVDWSLARNREDRVPSLKLLQDELELFARDQGFRGEMTCANTSIPCVAIPADTMETLPETQLGVRVHDLLSDATPPPMAKTRERAREGRRTDWIAWTLLGLSLAGSAVLHGQKPKQELTPQLLSAANAGAPVAAPSSESSVCADAASLDAERLALNERAEHVEPTARAPKKALDPLPPTAALKAKRPVARAQTASPDDDTKRSITKILAF